MTAAETVPLLPPGSSNQGRRNPKAMAPARRGSFDEVEKFCLHALLIDDSTSMTTTKPQETKPLKPCRQPSMKKRLDDNVLFQIPFSSASGGDVKNSQKFGRHEKAILGLWQAHQDGAHPVIMNKRNKSSNFLTGSRPGSRLQSFDNPQSPSVDGMSCGSHSRSQSSTSTYGALSVKSDVEVRAGLDVDDRDEDSSWDESEGGFIHYNAWEVLNDEYAEDFGFEYKETLDSVARTLANEDDATQGHVFKIIGTSADDVTAQPHVLSPPLMDSLFNFVPESLSMENVWLKFSLIRDGSSLYTLKQYVKAARYTLLAIETTKGQVFGAFTSHTWRDHPTWYGGAPCFLWRMRQSRQTACHSLFEQAQMESEIDVYGFSGLNDLVQVCDETRIAIGGGNLVPDWELFEDFTHEPRPNDAPGIKLEHLESGQSFGFGIALDEDLLGGTTSPCGTFRNPCLVDHMSKGEVFEVANLELWTFTPTADVVSAERMEMTRFFVEESIRSVASSQSSKNVTSDMYANPFNSQAEFQRDFYRRVGHGEPTDNKRRSAGFVSASARL